MTEPRRDLTDYKGYDSGKSKYDKERDAEQRDAEKLKEKLDKKRKE